MIIRSFILAIALANINVLADVKGSGNSQSLAALRAIYQNLPPMLACNALPMVCNMTRLWGLAHGDSEVVEKTTTAFMRYVVKTAQNIGDRALEKMERFGRGQ